MEIKTMTSKNFWLRPKTILWLIIFVILTTFIFQNVEPTTVDFLFWSLPEVPKLILILLSMLTGGILAIVLRWEITRHK